MDDGPWQNDDSGEGGNCFNWNKIPVPTDLCDLCADRTAMGKLPTCVHHCQAGVMVYGTLEELAAKAKAAAKDKMVIFAK